MGNGSQLFCKELCGASRAHSSNLHTGRRLCWAAHWDWWERSSTESPKEPWAAGDLPPARGRVWVTDQGEGACRAKT